MAELLRFFPHQSRRQHNGVVKGLARLTWFASCVASANLLSLVENGEMKSVLWGRDGG